jgi:shikimate dehydrogenase
MHRPLTLDFRLGLIGYPLSHSLSPKLHTAALRACGLAGDYSLFPIQPDDSQSLKDLLSRLRSSELHGLNVTIPHKQNVVPLLDELTPTAKSIGAVNTIYLRDNKLIGDNTDAPGFLTDLKRFLDQRKSGIGNRESSIVHGPSSIVLGAGGSARAVVYALLHDGWEVTISARRVEQAKELAMSFMNYQVPITNYELSGMELSNISLIVNTTPLGMTRNSDQSPWPENLPFPPHAAIYDLVYNPRETKLVRDACLQGLPAKTGLGMLIEQAALAFEIWTGHNPPRAVMLNAVDQTDY